MEEPVTEKIAADSAAGDNVKTQWHNGGVKKKKFLLGAPDPSKRPKGHAANASSGAQPEAPRRSWDTGASST